MIILTIIGGLLGAIAVYFGSFKIDVKPKLLKERGVLTARQKILDKIASIYLFSLLLIITLGSWFLLGFTVCYGLVLRNWSFFHSMAVFILAILGIFSPFSLLLCWRRGYFDI
jgi:uncharacterized membrane protein